MKKFKIKKAFTLIEVLAVIVVLTLILLIVIPNILNIINDSRKSSFESTVSNLIKIVQNDYVKRTLSNDLDNIVYSFNEDGTQTIEPEHYDPLEFSGKGPTGGYIVITPDGNIRLELTDGKFIIEKQIDSKLEKAIVYDGRIIEIPTFTTYSLYNNEYITSLIEEEEQVPQQLEYLTSW